MNTKIRPMDTSPIHSPTGSRPGGVPLQDEMPRAEYKAFQEEFQKFQKESDFKNEVSPMMLKYWVQMAFYLGWKRSGCSMTGKDPS